MGEDDVELLECQPYIAKSHLTAKGRAFAKCNDVITFAKKVKAYLKEACPGFLSSPILRVDIFRMQSGKLVVNELESLEAVFKYSRIIGLNPDGTIGTIGTANSEGNLQTFMSKFWKNKIGRIIESVKKRKLNDCDVI